MHSNIRGLKSKVQSLNHVANNIVMPDCISLNEHGIRGNNTVKIQNCHSFNKNRVNKRMSGVSLSIPEDKAKSFMKVNEGDGANEFIIIRNDECKPPINIMSYYGENECRVSREELFERWQKVMIELRKIEERNEHIIIASDLNRKVGNDSPGIEGNSDKISYDGWLVQEMIASGK